MEGGKRAYYLGDPAAADSAEMREQTGFEARVFAGQTKRGRYDPALLPPVIFSFLPLSPSGKDRARSAPVLPRTRYSSLVRFLGAVTCREVVPVDRRPSAARTDAKGPEGSVRIGMEEINDPASIFPVCSLPSDPTTGLNQSLGKCEWVFTLRFTLHPRVRSRKTL